MLQDVLARARRQLSTRRAVIEQFENHGGELVASVDLRDTTGREEWLDVVAYVLDMRPDDRRAARNRGLQHVVSTACHERAADEPDIRRRV